MSDTKQVKTKQIKDYDLQSGITGDEDILIQKDGSTKRIKAFELMDAIDMENYYTKEQVNELFSDLDINIDGADFYDKETIDNLLKKKADTYHTHTISEINNLEIPTKISDLTNDKNFVDDAYVALQIPTKVSELQNDSDFANKSFVTNKINEDLSKYAQQSDLDLLESTVENLKQSVSDGKDLIASAITDKGVTTSNTETFSNMANNIRKISSSEQTISVQNIMLNYSSLTLSEGESIRLIPVFTPSNATNQEVTWSFSTSGICTIANGTIVAISSGYTVVTVTSVDGGYSASCSITVKEATIPVTGVSLNKSSVTLLQGATIQLSATVYPTNATNQTVSYSSVTPTVATVNSYGLITAITSGTSVIVVTTQDGNYQASCSVVVQIEQEEEEEDIPTGSETLEDTSVRNLVPYISTYYTKPTILPNETFTLNYFVTDYYGRSYTQDSDFYRYTIIVKCDGMETINLNNIQAGEHSITIGSFANEGTYHYSIMAVDQYGRCSHELFNYVRVKQNTNYNTYTVTASDISYYGITMNVSREIKHFVDCSSTSSNEAIASLVQNAYDNTTVPSGKYIVFIPDRDNTQNYKGVNCDWSRCMVKYASDYNIDVVKQECANNRIKIQQLLEDKVASGYNKVVMYKATYVIDENAIEIPSGLDWDLNGSTIKMNPFTGQGALMVRMTDAIDTHLHNGVIEGDYFAHDYANSEYNSEWVSGFEMGGSCRYCSVHDLTVKDITGYGMQNGISNTSSLGYSFFNPVLVGDMETGDIDKTTGQNIDCSYRLRSNMVNISSYQGKSDFLTVSIHLNYQGNEFDTWNMVVYFYTSNQQFIKAINGYQYRQIKIPDGAYYARTVMYGSRIKNNWNIYYHFLRVPTHCEYRNITVDNARCVGMAQGQMKDFLVKDCTISNSGQSSATCAYDAEDGWDGMQDVFIDNLSFPSNPNNCFLTCAGHNFVLENSDLVRGHYLWERSRWVVIRNCVLEQGTIRGGGESNIVQHGIARYYNNTLTGLTYSLNFVSNILKNCILSNKPQSGILINCTVGGTTITKEICNDDINNPCVDDYGSLNNVDTGQTENNGGSSGGTSVTGIKVSNSPITIAPGGNARISYVIYPSIATNQSVSFSSNSSCITVSSDGVITVNSDASAGNYSVTLTTNDGGHTAECIVIISANSSSETVAVTGITLNEQEVTMYVNDTRSFSYSIQPNNATNQTVYWYTASGNCSVDSATGLVTANFVGVDYINVATYDGHYVASCKINVVDSNSGSNVPVSSVTLSTTNLSINVNEQHTLVATVLPSNATNKNLTWTTSNSSVVSVSAGTVTGISEGNAFVTVTTQDGSYSATCQIVVSNNNSSDGSSDGGNTESGFYISNTTMEYASYVLFNHNSIGVTPYEDKAVLCDASTNEVLATGMFEETTRAIIYLYDLTVGTYTVYLSKALVSDDGRTYTPIAPTSNTFTLTLTSSGDVGDGDSGGGSEGTTTTTYGGIVLSNTSSSINDNSSGSFSVKLDSAPTQNQVVYISSNSSYVSVSPQSITFTPSNYSTYQTITYTASCNNDSGYSTTITVSSANVSSKTFNLTVTHINTGGSTGGNYEEKDSSGLVIVQNPVTQKANPTYWCALGDSITAGTGAGGSSYAYCNVAANTIGNCVINNYGIAGSCINDGYNLALTEPGYEDAFCNRYVEMADGADLVTILGSVNDHRADSKIGTIDSTDTETFYGALNVLITGLKSKYPNARIVFITPFKTADWQGTNMYGFTMTDFRNAIVGACNKHQIEVLDLFPVRQLSWLVGLTSTPSLFYQYDYYHPTPDGHKAIANYLIEQMFGGTESGGSSGESSGSTNVSVTGINVSEWDVKLEAGQSKTLTYEVTPSTATNKTVYWSNSNYSVVDISYTDSTITINTKSEGYSAITATTADGGFTYVVHVNVSASSSSGGSTSSSGIANASETALTQQYSSSHEATPNAKISNLAGTAYYWKDKPRINPDGSFPSSTWNAFGHWMTTYLVEGASYYDNVGLLLQNPKAWIWNTSTQSWDVLSSDFEWGSWYLEDFWDDGSSYIAGTTQWETGASGNHSTWVKIKQTSETSGRCFHPWGYQKDWRSNSNWSNNGCPYIVTKIDFKLVKWDESGADNLAYANIVVNSGGDWWSAVGATWQPDWSTNRDMCVGKYVKATKDLKRAWATNLPSSWTYGLPTGD